MNRAKCEMFLRPKRIAVSVAACFALHAAQLQANPSGPTVVSGSVGFGGLGTSALSITNQGGANAIINWNGFSIGVNELTRFQQFANLAVLNRVTGNEVSSILGALQSDGRLFLINPNGIVFGASARVDVAGLVASSLNLSNQDFLANRLRFTEVPGAGAVVNNGVIATQAGGRVFLVAPTVENNGLIQSARGDIVLAAGKEVELVDGAFPFVTVKVASDADSATNVGTLIADGGRIGMFGPLVRNAGTVSASAAVAGPGGEIRLVAAKDLTLDAGSVVSANGTSGGKVLLQAQGGTNLIDGTVEAKGSTGNGGQVDALGVRVGVVGKGVIDASGDTGGGTVRLGGDYQGKNPDVQNAERTYIGSDGVIRADAMSTGDGGRVIVWADGDTRFFGSISARGGAQSGKGGFVETSGKQSLQVFGAADVGAASGTGGTWLLDPEYVSFVSGTGANDADVQYGGTLVFTAPPSPGTSQIGSAAIDAGLAAYGASVEIQAQKDINFNANLNLANSGNLALTAGNNINFNTFGINASSPSGLSVMLTANDPRGPASGTGSITSLAGGGNITAPGGYINVSGASIALGNINTAGGVYGGSSVNLSATAGSASMGSLTTDGGYVFVSATGDINSGAINTAAAQFGGGVSLTSANGNIVTGAITTGGGYVAGTAYGSISVAGTINTSGPAFLGDGSGSIDLTADNGNITTGSIITRSLFPIYCADGCGYTQPGNGGNVNLQASGKIVINGDIDARGADGVDGGSSYYAGSAGGNVNLTRFGAAAVSGPAVYVAGNIRTSGGSGFSAPDAYGGSHAGGYGGNVMMQGGQAPLVGDIQVGGYIDTSGGHAGSSDNGNSATNGGLAGQIYGSATGSISTGALIANGGNAGAGGDGFNGFNSGGDAGDVYLTSTSGSVSVASIDVSGGAGGVAGGGGTYSIGGSGGSGSYVQIQAPVSISAGNLTARGGSGGAGAGGVGYSDATGGTGGDGGYFYLYSQGPVTTGSADFSGASGGAGGMASSARGGDGGYGGYLDVYGTSINVAGSILGRGGNGGAGGTNGTSSADGGSAGWAGSVYLNAGNGSVTTGSMDLIGGTGGNGGTGFSAAGGDGGEGGYINLYGASITTGSILAMGSAGGTGGTATDAYGGSSGGYAGWGGSVYLYAHDSSTNLYGPITTGQINVSGGNGGSSGAVGTATTWGGTGGDGGYVSLEGDVINVLGPILAKGGNGGDLVNASLSTNAIGNSGGNGGGYGSVNVRGTSTVQINVGGTLGATAIDVSGGAGGNGNASASPAGSGGSGGGGGSAIVYGTPDMTLFGSVNASGGAGGAGGASGPSASGYAGGAGGAGGIAGSIYLDASSATGSATGDGIIFVLGGTQFNVQGGAGGAGGADFGAGAGAGGLAGSTGTFNPMSDYFGTIVVLDPLSIPEVNSQFQQTLKASDQSTTFVGGEEEKKDEDKSKKEFGACKA